MSAGELVLPKDMATPSEVELKASGVDPQKIGMFFFFSFFLTVLKIGMFLALMSARGC